MKLKFKLKDFDQYCAERPPSQIRYITPEEAAYVANQIFDSWFAENIEAAPVVYVEERKNFDQKQHSWKFRAFDFDFGDHTHQARLVNIEPIKKEECKHDSVNYLRGIRGEIYDWKCNDCGKRLKPQWSILE